MLLAGEFRLPRHRPQFVELLLELKNVLLEILRAHCELGKSVLHRGNGGGRLTERGAELSRGIEGLGLLYIRVRAFQELLYGGRRLDPQLLDLRGKFLRELFGVLDHPFRVLFANALIVFGLLEHAVAKLAQAVLEPGIENALPHLVDHEHLFAHVAGKFFERAGRDRRRAHPALELEHEIVLEARKFFLHLVRQVRVQTVQRIDGVQLLHRALAARINGFFEPVGKLLRAVDGARHFFEHFVHRFLDRLDVILHLAVFRLEFAQKLLMDQRSFDERIHELVHLRVLARCGERFETLREPLHVFGVVLRRARDGASVAFHLLEPLEFGCLLGRHLELVFRLVHRAGRERAANAPRPLLHEVERIGGQESRTLHAQLRRRHSPASLRHCRRRENDREHHRRRHAPPRKRCFLHSKMMAFCHLM